MGSERPTSLPVLLWGAGGVILMLATSVWRLTGQVTAMFAEPLGPMHVVVMIVWAVFMVYAEGWRGFHKQFAPRVVQRGWELPASNPLLVLLAPAVCMGLLYATRKRLIVSWCLVIGITSLVVLIRGLDQPWRGVVDLGVVLGLGTGTLSLIGFLIRALAGRPPGVVADWPVA